MAFGLSGRQLLILAPVALGVWGGFLALKDVLPVWALAAAAVPLAAVALVLALGRRDGMGLDAFALAAASWLRAPKQRSGALAAVEALPPWAPSRRREPRLAPLRLPASAVGEDGVIALDGREAVLIACSSVNVHLASQEEQDAAIGAFAAVLDSLAHPVQILLQGRSLELAPYTAMLRETAAELEHSALAEAARAHADFLDTLRTRCDLTRRQLVLVVTARPGAAEGPAPVVRIAEEVATQLGGLGVSAQRCDGAWARHLLGEAMEPWRHTPWRPARSEGDV
ncbi:hypothetical protein GCM10027570_35900 [Streptomonospora sediminis]